MTLQPGMSYEGHQVPVLVVVARKAGDAHVLRRAIASTQAEADAVTREMREQYRDDPGVSVTTEDCVLLCIAAPHPNASGAPATHPPVPEQLSGTIESCCADPPTRATIYLENAADCDSSELMDDVDYNDHTMVLFGIDRARTLIAAGIALAVGPGQSCEDLSVDLFGCSTVTSRDPHNRHSREGYVSVKVRARSPEERAMCDADAIPVVAEWDDGCASEGYVAFVGADGRLKLDATRSDGIYGRIANRNYKSGLNRAGLVD